MSLIIWQFSSELSNSWSTGQLYLCVSFIYCTGQQHKVPLFQSLFFCLSLLCSLLCHGLCWSFVQAFCPSTLGLLRHFSSRTLNALVSSGWIPVLGQVQCPFSWCHKLLPFCPVMFQLISHYYKNFHVRSDDSGLNFCLRAIILCPKLVPLGCIYLHVTDITWCCLTHYSYQHSIFCYFPWIVHPKFQATLPCGHGFTKRHCLLWVANWPEFP